jgi:hypothetical protein
MRMPSSKGGHGIILHEQNLKSEQEAVHDPGTG